MHENDDLPTLRDLGFAVSPGVHGLVAAKYSNVSGKWITKPQQSFHKLHEIGNIGIIGFTMLEQRFQHQNVGIELLIIGGFGLMLSIVS